jgi:aminoglycoside phosphotransferase (APT) family kinase protein
MSGKKILVERPSKKIYLEDGKVYKVMGDAYLASDVLHEALNLAAVGETELRVPKLLEVTKIDGEWAIVWEYIQGNTLAELIEKNPGQADAYLDRFVEIQMKMHLYNASRLPSLFEKLHRKISVCGLDATVRYELHTRLEGLPRHTKLCHGDFNPSNIIITDKDEDYIIDWSHATQGNASADAAQTYLLFYLAGQQDRAEKYLDLFCKKTDTAKQYVQKWLSIVAASQLVKGKFEEREILLRWANVAEYQ